MDFSCPTSEMAVSLAAEGRLTPETGQAIRFAGTTLLCLDRDANRVPKHDTTHHPAPQTPQKVSKHTYLMQFSGSIEGGRTASVSGRGLPLRPKIRTCIQIFGFPGRILAAPPELALPFGTRLRAATRHSPLATRNSQLAPPFGTQFRAEQRIAHQFARHRHPPRLELHPHRQARGIF